VTSLQVLKQKIRFSLDIKTTWEHAVVAAERKRVFSDLMKCPGNKQGLILCR
jgi:hypothetical protein